jgi:hypothetical protein
MEVAAPHLDDRAEAVGDGDVVMRVDVAGKRRQGAVRHADRERRRVLERVRHREQQDVHDSPQQPRG